VCWVKARSPKYRHQSPIRTQGIAVGIEEAEPSKATGWFRNPSKAGQATGGGSEGTIQGSAPSSRRLR
jgi:hypothetical protein